MNFIYVLQIVTSIKTYILCCKKIGFGFYDRWVHYVSLIDNTTKCFSSYKPFVTIEIYQKYHGNEEPSIFM